MNYVMPQSLDGGITREVGQFKSSDKAAPPIRQFQFMKNNRVVIDCTHEIGFFSNTVFSLTRDSQFADTADYLDFPLVLREAVHYAFKQFVRALFHQKDHNPLFKHFIVVRNSHYFSRLEWEEELAFNDIVNAIRPSWQQLETLYHQMQTYRI